MLNEDGGIETDLTVVCVDKNYFRIVSSAATRERDKFHINKYLSKEVKLRDVTDDYCVFGLFGPKSRLLMEKLSTDDFSNENFKFAHSKTINIDETKIWAQRMSYIGELGYELYVKTSEAKNIYNKIVEEGKNFKLSNCGMHSLDVMRMESGFYIEVCISPEENQYQAGLEFAISYKKDVNFIGRDALEKIKNLKPDRKFCIFTLKNTEPGNPLLLHDEPIYFRDEIIGKTTSGNYSFNYKKNLVFGYIKGAFTDKLLNEDKFYVEIEKKVSN